MTDAADLRSRPDRRREPHPDGPQRHHVRPPGLPAPATCDLLLGQDKRFEAALLLGALGATDWIDGYVARRFHQVSKLGKMLDPMVDRLLFFVGDRRHPRRSTARAGRGSAGWCSSARCSSAGVTVGLAARGQADRCHLVRQGRHVRPDVRLPALPRRLERPSRAHRSSTALGWIAGVPGLLLTLLRRDRSTSRIGLRALREGRAARSSPAAG